MREFLKQFHDIKNSRSTIIICISGSGSCLSHKWSTIFLLSKRKQDWNRILIFWLLTTCINKMDVFQKRYNLSSFKVFHFFSIRKNKYLNPIKKVLMICIILSYLNLCKTFCKINAKTTDTKQRISCVYANYFCLCCWIHGTMLHTPENTLSLTNLSWKTL